MKQPELYQKTVDILVAAYFNDTLRHGDCEACAVGNIVYAAGGTSRSETGIMTTDSCGRWKVLFFTCDGIQENLWSPESNPKLVESLGKTGYSWQDLAKIEFAFETAPKGNSDDEWMFNGLMAVIDVLDQIHENNDPVATTATKQRFVKSI